VAVATFDTLKFANTLKASGVPEKQAEAQAVAFSEVIQLNFKELVTKDDLSAAVKALENKLDNQVDLLKSEFNLLKADFKSLRSELKSEVTLLKWMVGVSISIGIAVLVRLFFFHPPL
jgi:ABC-type phosphate transport system auxiliary subunit